MAVLFTKAKTRKQCKCPLMDEGIQEMYVCVYMYMYTHTYVCSGILFIQKRKEILPVRSTWIDLEDIMLDIMTEINQSEKDNKSVRERQYCMISPISGIRTVAKGRRQGVRRTDKGGQRHKLPVIR